MKSANTWFWMIAVFCMSLPHRLLAQSGDTGDLQGTCRNDEGEAVICNPLQVDSVMGLLDQAVDAIVYIAVPFLVVIIIVVGFQFVAAQGNEEKIESAKRNALYVGIGAAVILGAQLLTDVLINTATSLGVEGLDTN